MSQQEQSLARFYQSSVSWVIDERDIKIINRYHNQEFFNTKTSKIEKRPKEFVVEKLWRGAMVK